MTDKFSDRIGATQPRRHIQLNGMDQALRNALWNWVCWALKKDSGDYREEFWRNAALGGVWDEVFHLPNDDVPDRDIQEHVKDWFMKAEWFDVYNFIEYLLPRVNYYRSEYQRRDKLDVHLNYYLEREVSGYRAVRDQLVPITSAPEIAGIEEAANRRKGFEGVAEHIDAALALLSKKPDPDYRNSIKESISAVEATAKLLTGEKSGGIDKAIAILERAGLHPSFKTALSKLYGYTSDKNGIRHPILDEESHTGFAEAKFMLVVCSAFVNFLIDSSRRVSA